MLEVIIEINGSVNTQVRYQTEPYGRDDWQTPAETSVLGTGDCEDIAIAKYVALRERDYQPELVYCLWADPRTQRRIAHMICVVGTLVLDNIAGEVKTVEERQDLNLIYAISHRGLRNWGQDKLFPVRQHNRFHELVRRLERGA